MKKYKIEAKVIGTATSTFEIEAVDASDAFGMAEDIVYNSELEWDFDLNDKLPPKLTVEPLTDAKI